MVDRKSLEPFVCFHPFVLLGSPNSLADLRALGFQTFAPFIDETYDEIEDPAARFAAAYGEIKRLITQSDDSKSAMINELSSRLLHNARHLVFEMPRILRQRWTGPIVRTITERIDWEGVKARAASAATATSETEATAYYKLSIAPGSPDAELTIFAIDAIIVRNVEFNTRYGGGVAVSGAPGGVGGIVYLLIYEFEVLGGNYDVWIEYASAEKRPIKLCIDDLFFAAAAAGDVTGGWHTQQQMWHYVFNVPLRPGKHRLELRSNSYFPHIRRLSFETRPLDRSRVRKSLTLSTAPALFPSVTLLCKKDLTYNIKR